MKYLLMARAFAAACPLAQALSNVTIYGTLDAGLIKRTGSALAVGKPDANTPRFRGTAHRATF